MKLIFSSVFFGFILFAVGCCKTLDVVLQEYVDERRQEIVEEHKQDNAVYEWSRGGFNGENAVEIDSAVIADLKVSGNGMNYRWVKGGCEEFGAPDRSNADYTLACLFVSKDGVNYVGGKFDWISTSRTTRDFHNIHGNYHGWSSKDLESAKYYAFCIVSRDGKRRTNIIKVAK